MCPPRSAEIRVTELPFDVCTPEGRSSLDKLVETMMTTHRATLHRLLEADLGIGVLAEVLEDIGNRYLDLSEIVTDQERRSEERRTA